MLFQSFIFGSPFAVYEDARQDFLESKKSEKKEPSNAGEKDCLISLFLYGNIQVSFDAAKVKQYRWI